MIPPMDCILSQLNPEYSSNSYSLNVRFNIISYELLGRQEVSVR